VSLVKTDDPVPKDVIKAAVKVSGEMVTYNQSYCAAKILQFSPKLSLKLEYMVRRILIQRNEEKQSDIERNRRN
jgi:hypothetical protein